MNRQAFAQKHRQILARLAHGTPDYEKPHKEHIACRRFFLFAGGLAPALAHHANKERARQVFPPKFLGWQWALLLRQKTLQAFCQALQFFPRSAKMIYFVNHLYRQWFRA